MTPTFADTGRARLPIPTRADLLIEAAEKLGHRIIGSQDERKAERLAFECGVLRSHLRTLCAEVAAFAPIRSAGITYIEATMDRDIPVLAGIEWDGEDCDLTEVWLNGQEISQHLKSETLEDLRRYALKRIDEMAEDMRTDRAVDNLQRQREEA